MKEILLTRSDGLVAIVDDDDWAFLSGHRWTYLPPSRRNPSAYAQLSIRVNENGKWKTKSVLMHRMILGVDPGIQVDHINGDGLDNRKQNLRKCTQSQNQQNRRKFKKCSSKYKGVHWMKYAKKWRARISYQGTRISLGVFDTEAEAAHNYNLAATTLFGSFARLNVIDFGGVQ